MLSNIHINLRCDCDGCGETQTIAFKPKNNIIKVPSLEEMLSSINWVKKENEVFCSKECRDTGFESDDDDSY